MGLFGTKHSGAPTRKIEFREWLDANRDVAAGIVMAAVFVALLLHKAFATSLGDPKRTREPLKPAAPPGWASLTGDSSYEDLSRKLDAQQRDQATQLATLEREVRGFRQELEGARAEAERAKEEAAAAKLAAAANARDRAPGGSGLKPSPAELTESFAQLGGDEARARSAARAARDRLARSDSDGEEIEQAAAPRRPNARTVTRGPAGSAGSAPGADAAGPPAVPVDERFAGKITFASETREQPAAPLAEPKDPFWLPAGSFARGVMLYGVDAPTDGGFAEAPAVLIKAVDGFTGPNSAAIPLEGCMFIGSAKGNYSSGRADVKVVSISCTFGDRSFERELVGVVVGPDTHGGLPGELNDHLFEQLGWATIAGAGEGAADAFKTSNTRQVVGAYSTTTFVDPTRAAEYAAAGAGSGAARQLGAVALEHVRRLAPTVTVTGGELVWIVTLKGVALDGLDEHLGTVVAER